MLIALKMETYKALNRELTIKNQELRQYVSSLRDELCEIRGKLVTEREQQMTLKKAIITIVTESFNKIVNLMYDNELDNQCMGSYEVINVLREEHSKAQNSNNTSGSIQDSTRTLQVNNKSMRNPLTEIQNKNVTIRNRRLKNFVEEVENIWTDLEENKELQENTESPSEAILDGPGEYAENDSDAIEGHLPIVIEETTNDLNPSVLYNCMPLEKSNSGLSIRKIVLENNEYTQISNQSRILRNLKRESTKQNYKSLDQTTSEAGQIREVAQLQTKNQGLLNITDTPLNESSFDNTNMQNAPSSTPYKIGEKNKDACDLRSLRVVIPRLKLEKLSLSKNLNISVRGLNSTNSFERKQGQNTTTITASRPKRRAAEAAKMNLIEPNINVKMRRNM